MLFVCMCVVAYPYEPGEDWVLLELELLAVGPRNQIQVLCKSTKCLIAKSSLQL